MAGVMIQLVIRRFITLKAWAQSQSKSCKPRQGQIALADVYVVIFILPVISPTKLYKNPQTHERLV
jgi:hypothetical protein